jgi:hypothetical protein|tara:strand:+ start:2240 stop:4219 length:1980 start_codon:yes stop_codon:yes gene_type:complete
MENILSINLETSTAPIVQEARGRDYIEYGTDDWKNLYPQFLIDLYYNSSTHAAIINQTAEMIAGEDLICTDEDKNLDAFVKLKKFLRHANSHESLHQVIKKVAFDFKLQGAYALHIVWNRERTEIAEVYHVPVERVRAGRPNEFGKVDTYFISADWANTRTNKPYPITAFNTNDRTAASQLLYTGSYSPNMDVYHTPDYLAANNWALVDQRVAEFHLNNIQNGFSGSYFISFANGVPTQEERFQIEQSLTDKFTGASNSGKFILTFSDDKTRTPEITPITVSDADKQYLALQELLVQNILTGHRVTSPMLMGIKNDTGLGSNVDELNAASNFYLNTVVKGFQLHILDTLQTIFSVNNMDLEVKFVQLKPITVEFTSEDLKAVMTEDEIREEVGLKPLADVEVREDFSKVGMIDGKPVFSTIEEAEAHAKTLGCTGYHEHKYEGKTSYMACEGHKEATELSKFIEEFGEDMSEEWELIDEEIVDGEHQDFDYEQVLNELADEKIELASTGSPKPSRKSEQDGISKKTYDYFRVRYVYENDNFLNNKSGTKRKFCRQMMGANKLYRKEDIINMGKKAVNPGFGIGGANTYSIWLYKGGPQCFHFWTRRIFKTVIGESRTTKIEDADLIGYTKARSEGFTAKKNDRLVAIPPRKMKNNGYYN